MLENQICILGVKIDALSKQKVLERIKDFLANADQRQIATVNAEFIMAAQADERFRSILNNCDLNTADGIGPIWAAKFLSSPAGSGDNKRGWFKLWRMVFTGASLIFWPSYVKSIIPERISGVDLMIDICHLAAKLDKKVFLLGGMPGVAQATAKQLSLEIPKLKIDWRLKVARPFKTSGFAPLGQAGGNWIFEDEEEKQNLVINNIKATNSDILFVAANHPKAQYWIDGNLSKLPSVKIAMGVGGAYDFISGQVKRAPKIFRQLGIEWLWRLLLQPWRYSRVFTATIKFVVKVYNAKDK